MSTLQSAAGDNQTTAAGAVTVAAETNGVGTHDGFRLAFLTPAVGPGPGDRTGLAFGIYDYYNRQTDWHTWQRESNTAQLSSFQTEPRQSDATEPGCHCADLLDH